jgi:hypothetical protein
MDIERLKELRKKIPEYYGNGFMSLVHCDNMLDLIDDAIARQSVKSEEVAEAIEVLECIYPSQKEIMSGEYPHVADALDLAITALQAYQPWIPVSNVKPESGKHVLLCCEIKPLGKRYVCDGYYAQSKTITAICDDDNNCEYDEETDEYYLIEGYYQIINNCDYYSSIAIEDFVTHWKPLPEPPKGE